MPEYIPEREALQKGVSRVAADAAQMRRIRADAKAKRARARVRDPERNRRLRELLIARSEDIAEVTVRYGATDISLFGSLARGDADQDSDIDLLVNLPGSYFDQALAMVELANELTELLGVRVDVSTRYLLAYRSDGGALRRRIECDEIPLTCLDF
ncbi:nucleotidyltransferase family protein [Rhodococcus erythropolis]|uniref:Nucleotidyltransferase domain-containing protein n=1 Tax=Rhodococcus erythropolis TaxID=1833 RepID=A0A8I0ZQR5_RHOER|nr:nucleotidyltransferase domain-containing protein [Rhodococcus erythropolis]MBH5141428.1 nucleotidyltransferase domain-containing protein [Rhodococcus erythropolis]